mmetsp:Transcript_27124/g.23991  ORF Transcript_27124/g.23991 Transcript_27124/m.23991 type:complete len:167 (+) Transcript_27124:30-530(+)
MDKGEIDEYGRPYPPKCGEYRIPHVAADAIVLRTHKDDDFHDILLITRGIEPSKGCLAFPGGHIDYNESPDHACIRELEEECGIKGTKPELFTVRGDATRDPRKHMITIVYSVTVDPDAGYKAGDDAATAEWYNLKEIVDSKVEKDFAFDHHSILSEYIDKKLTGY